MFGVCCFSVNPTGGKMSIVPGGRIVEVVTIRRRNGLLKADTKRIVAATVPPVLNPELSSKDAANPVKQRPPEKELSKEASSKKKPQPFVPPKARFGGSHRIMDTTWGRVRIKTR